MLSMTDPQKAAVIGHPIGHTMSPFIQKRLFALAGLPLEYSVLDIPDLAAGMGALRELDCFNVTIPHKAAIIPYLDELDEKARLFGSVNTVKVRGGRMTGYTTDGAGCFKALENHGLDLSGQVLILGNGGAARAIAFEAAVRRRDFHITLACRKSSLPKALALGEELAGYARRRGDRKFLITVSTYEELEAERHARYDLLVNATSVGMVPYAGASPVTKQVVSCCAAVFDAVYNPAETALLRMARDCGAKTVGGMEMLVYQAVAAHECWYGTSFRPEDIAGLCGDAERELARLFGGDKG